MASSYTTNKNLEKPDRGDYVDSWDVPLNGDMNIIDAALGGVTSLNATSGNATLTASQYQKASLNITGAMSANVTYTIPSGVGGIWIVRNATTDSVGGPWTVTIASAGGGTSVVVIRGKSPMVWSDGTNIRDVNENVVSIGTVSSVNVSGGTTGLTTSGGPITSNGTITIGGVLGVANGGTNLTSFGVGVSGALSSNVTGSGGIVLSSNATINTPTLTAPVLGTPTSGNLSNTTNIPVANATGTLAVVNGGTGATTLIANSVIIGNGTNIVKTVAPGANGNILQSDGTNWASAAMPASVPTGSVMPYAGTSAPSGWLLSDGSAISRSTYADLFAAIGTTYGSGDGSTTFNLPDLRGRMPAGKDNMGGSSANRITAAGSGITGTTLGASGGAENVTLTTATMPSHSHSITIGVTSSKGSSVSGYTTVTGTNTSQGTTSTGSDGAHNNMGPTLILNYIIKT